MRIPYLVLLFLTILLTNAVFSPMATAAQENPPAIKVSLNLNELIAFAEENEEIASLLKEAVREIADEVQVSSLDEAIEKANEVVGMDIRKDVRRLNLQLGSGFSPTDDFSLDVIPVDAVLHTSKPGNLQGLLLMTPGYSSEESDQGTLHVIQIEDEQRVYVKFTETDDGVFTAASLDKSRLKSASWDSPEPQRSPSDGRSGELLRATIDKSMFADLAEELEHEDVPPANMLRNMISEMRGLNLVVRREGEGVAVDLISQLGSEDKAEQQFQAISGGKAIAQMMLESEGAPEEVKQIVQILDSLEVTHVDSYVQVRMLVPSIVDLINLIESM